MRQREREKNAVAIIGRLISRSTIAPRRLEGEGYRFWAIPGIGASSDTRANSALGAEGDDVDFASLARNAIVRARRSRESVVVPEFVPRRGYNISAASSFARGRYRLVVDSLPGERSTFGREKVVRDGEGGEAEKEKERGATKEREDE